MLRKSIPEFNAWLKKGIDFLNSKLIFELCGEISSIKIHQSGHVYATLKEGTDSLNIIIWKSTYSLKNEKLNVGDNVIIKGKINYYSPNSSISFVVSTYTKESSDGDLKVYLEKIKNKYADLGYFSNDKKINKPQVINTIGIVTSKSGEAINDIVKTINRRNPLIKIILFPCLVQGSHAKTDIADKVNKANKYKKYEIDALIIGRGGGSFEDLFSFNEPEVIEAIYNSEIYTISAVGHEGDNLLSDLVADERASTPTAAAELLTTQTIDDKINAINNHEQFLDISFSNKFESKYNILQNIDIDTNILKYISSLYSKTDFNNININDKFLIYDNKLKSYDFSYLINNKINTYEKNISVLDETISNLGPKSLLNRGYSIITSSSGDVINSVNKLNDEFNITFSDGTVKAKKV